MERSSQSNPARSRVMVALALTLITATAALLLAGPVRWAIDSDPAVREPDPRPTAELVAEKAQARARAQAQPPRDSFELDAPGSAAPGAFWAGASLASGGLLYLALAGALWRGSARASSQIVVIAVGAPLAAIWLLAGLWLLALAFSPNWGA